MTTLALAMMLTNPAGLKLSALFSDNMVLQRDIAAPVFGTGDPGTAVEVEIAGQRAETHVKPDGTWMVRLRPLRAGGPYTLTVNNGVASARNVMVGEVWVASGQSNMEWNLSWASPEQYQEAQGDPRPDLRMFTVPKLATDKPARDVVGSWNPASRETVAAFSAVGYWFARELHDRLKVPVGVIHTSWGGTPAEAWTSPTALGAEPSLRPMVANYIDGLNDYPQRKAAYDKALLEFTESRKDIGNEGLTNGWASPTFDDSSWRSVAVTTAVEQLEGRSVDGAFWFRRTFEVPQELVGKELLLELGAIDDHDRTYLNGVEVGATGPETPNHWSTLRAYRIPAGAVRAGTNSIAVRVFDTGGGGGFTGQPSQLRLSAADGSTTASVPLGGNWKYKVERIAQPEGDAPSAPFGPDNPWAPGSLYNGMLAPVIPYGIRGAIWYQGESNASRAYQYRTLFPTMIQDWRRRWGQGNFPFYFVQLANFMQRNPQPVESAWAELREAQTMTLKLPNTGMATIIDIGEAADIHPKNKKDVGRRLAFNALAQTYRQNVVATGPMFQSMQVRGNTVRLRFTNGEGLKTLDGRPVVGFAVAGADKKFHWADAKIEGSTLVLSSPQVTAPVAVRYGWSDNPDVNLVNAAGLPAVPFRTDVWPGLTVNAK